MDLISAAYADLSDEDSSDPWSSSRVSTKRTIRDADSTERVVKKQLTNLPRPKFFEEVTANKYVDNPNEHDGKVRSFAHERGNWASFIYIPWEVSESFMEVIGLWLRCFQEFGIELTKTEDHHISLTRTVVLRHHWIPEFVASVRKLVVEFSRFPVIAKNFSIYTNEEKTRTFFALDVHDFSNNLNMLVQGIDTCLQEYNLPTYYENPIYHVSIAWCVGDRKAEFEELISKQCMSPENVSFTATTVNCKIGNLLHVCGLK